MAGHHTLHQPPALARHQLLRPAHTGEVCLLSAVCCVLSAIYCLLSAVCCLLSAACCLLSPTPSSRSIPATARCSPRRGAVIRYRNPEYRSMLSPLLPIVVIITVKIKITVTTHQLVPHTTPCRHLYSKERFDFRPDETELDWVQAAFKAVSIKGTATPSGCPYTSNIL
jgi:hypothetical protein